MHHLPTLFETLAQLKKAGYTEDFNLNKNYLAGQRSAIQLSPEEFVVDQHFRFEGNSDPDDEAIVYAISALHFNLKGTLVNGYGPSSDAGAAELIRALQEKIT
ncbi:phosphoribosylpyrophosphate synthetase [Hymenobacter psoromatis]|uniref:phosphoribosylpyrophosphate synthetase n=1 Tax=Hymenobacter psoromatis TaxID=1484116 RepID=UPI001CBFD752|nr:phosphoribosylpyrophosphate synthetase [Hymenobacter psoromatis]